MPLALSIIPQKPLLPPIQMENQRRKREKGNTIEGENEADHEVVGSGANHEACSTVSEAEVKSTRGGRRSRSPRPNRAAKRDQRHRGRDPCSGCGGKTHSFTQCYLVLGEERDWLPEEARETIKSNNESS